MEDDFYAEKLAWFKQNEKPEAVLLVADNPERIKIVIAWTNLVVGRTQKLTQLKSETENEVWDWLWENTIYSKKELIEKIGTPFSELALDGKLKPLIGNVIHKAYDKITVKRRLLFFSSVVIVLVVAMTGCRSPNNLSQSGTITDGKLTVEEASKIIGLPVPVPTYFPEGYRVTSVELKAGSMPQAWNVTRGCGQ